ncbi:hypothetical protein ACTJKJ_27150 [Roseateles sp. 22389]|uniref:hypothetical protein n=1 Tax=Roseateles sp. 22389 TaxID=3453916 RepID=UPI003F85F643
MASSREEKLFRGFWCRAQLPGSPALTQALLDEWARQKGMSVTSVQERSVGLFRPIPAIVLEADGRKACYPLISTDSAAWQANRAAADRTAALWNKVEWFCPLWVSNAKLGELLASIQHLSGEAALQQFDYHLSTAYTPGFLAVCIAQLLSKTRSLAVFAPLAREAFLAFYSGQRASSVAALIPAIEGGLQRIASATPNMKYKEAIDHTCDRACGLAADLYFERMWVPDEFQTKEFLFGQDERVFVFETFRRWLQEHFFQDLDKYSGATSLNRHLFAHGKSIDWQQPSNFSRLVVALTTLGVIEAWHDESNSVPILFPAMDTDATLLWQQAQLRVQLQMVLNLHEQAAFHAEGRLVPEMPTDDGVTLRKAVLSQSAIDDLVRPLREAGWSVSLTEPDDKALYVIATATAPATATSESQELAVALLYSCATDTALYRDLAERVDVILYRGPPFHQESYACGITRHVGPAAGWQPPVAPSRCPCPRLEAPAQQSHAPPAPSVAAMKVTKLASAQRSSA